MSSIPLFVSLMIHIDEKKLPQEFGKENLTVSLTKSASIGYVPAFIVFISRYVAEGRDTKGKILKKFSLY